AALAPSPASGQTIYLAETTYDLRDDRDQIKRELRQHGHTVLPDKDLPLEAARFEVAVREYLARAQFSIHLIGKSYGVIPEMEQTRSVGRLQYELAAERQEAEFFRLIWLPKELKLAAVADERQRHFINYVQQDSSARKGDEL